MKTNRLPLMFLSLIVAFTTLLEACAPVATPTAAPATQAPSVATEAPTVAPTQAPTEAAEPVTIQYWHTHSDPETAQLDKVIAAFEATNPGIKIAPSRYAYNDYKTALLTAISSGDVPDVARLDIAWVSEFADQGALVQLDGKLPDFDTIVKDTYPGPLSTNFWKGHYYGLPLDTNTPGLLWNKRDFGAGGDSASPATMEEFAADACKLTDAAKKQYGYAEGGTYFWAPAPVFYAMGGKVTDENITTDRKSTRLN